MRRKIPETGFPDYTERYLSTVGEHQGSGRDLHAQQLNYYNRICRPLCAAGLEIIHLPLEEKGEVVVATIEIQLERSCLLLH